MIRDAVAADAGSCAEIYAPYVRETAISFESEPPTAGEMAGRIAEAQRAHAWLVLEDDGVVVGYAYGGPFMARAAYQWAAGVSVYLAAGRRRTGGGRALYEALLDRLAGRGVPHRAGRDRPAQRAQRRPAPRARASSRSAPTGGWAGSSAAGTTWPGTSGPSATTATDRPPRSADRCAPARGGLVRRTRALNTGSVPAGTWTV